MVRPLLSQGRQYGEVTTIEVIPAIDIRGGKCVRLYQGAYDQETVYAEDPLEVALRWQGMGAPRLHIVDLDGASEGTVVNFDLIKTIAQASLIPTQVGGGIRTLQVVQDLLKAGVDRVILGTQAVEDPMFVREACRKFSDSVIVSLDARDGFLATHGWLNQTERGVMEFARLVVGMGATRFIYTDIIRDGTLTEPNFTAISELMNELRLPVIAAGGIATINHLKMLQQLGAEGAIVGKALYSGAINFKEALREVTNAERR